MSLGAKGGQTTTSTVTPDEQTQAARRAIYGAGQSVVDGPQYKGLFAGAGDLGKLGLSAMGGDATAFSKFMNPYLEQVLKASGAQFDKAGASAVANVNDAATRAGAFGGSRAQVGQAVAQGNIARDRAAQAAQLIYTGFNDSQARAREAAATGVNGFTGLAQLPGQIFSPVMQAGGQTSTQTQPGGDLLGGLVGTGLSIGGLLAGGPAGAAVGKAVGGGANFSSPFTFGLPKGYGIGK